MKIAFLNIYNGVVNRGAETFVKELASRLVKKYKVDVFQAGERSGDEKYNVIRIPVDFNWKKKIGVGTLASRFFIDYWNRLVFLFTLRSCPKIWEKKYDVVVPVNGGWMPSILRVITWLYGGKLVVSGQSGVGWDDRNNLWCFPDVFVALSAYAKDWAKRVNPFVRVEYIPNGVDLQRFKVGKSKTKRGVKQVLAVGAFVADKRLELAIDAVSHLEGVKLKIAGGSGDLRDKILDYGLRKLGKGRFELISVPYHKMPEVYRGADVFTLPSKSSEAFGNVLVEAMACGLPVVATDDPIRREIVGEAGILVDPTDVDSYSIALREALSRDWDSLPRRQAERFSWDVVADKYIDLLSSLYKG